MNLHLTIVMGQGLASVPPTGTIFLFLQRVACHPIKMALRTPPTQPNIENQEQLNKLRGKINSMLPVNFTTKTSKTENTKQP